MRGIDLSSMNMSARRLRWAAEFDFGPFGRCAAAAQTVPIIEELACRVVLHRISRPVHFETAGGKLIPLARRAVGFPASLYKAAADMPGNV